MWCASYKEPDQGLCLQDKHSTNWAVVSAPNDYTKSFEPELNQQPKDYHAPLTAVLSTNWAIEDPALKNS